MGDKLHDEGGKALGWSIPAHPDEDDRADPAARAVRFADADFDFEVKRENVEQQQRRSDHEPVFDLSKMEEVSLGSSAPKSCLLYGVLELEIIEAKALPNMDWFSEKASQVFSALGGSACLRGGSGGGDEIKQRRLRSKITSDPYVVVSLGDAILAKTKVISNSEDPGWRERFRLHVAHSVSELLLVIKDNDVFGAQLIGSVKIPASVVAGGAAIAERWFDVLGSDGKPVRLGAQLKLSMRYTPVEQDKQYLGGVGSSSSSSGVARAYFPLRRGGSIKLYQDAHCHGAKLPEIKLDGGGGIYKRGNCWEDICQAIVEAHHLVYIAGWSVFHKVKIVRDGEGRGRFSTDIANLTLGELLKRKAAEGVRVLLLVWDDKTSHHTPLFTTEGVMGTSDEKTKKYFRFSSVKCVLAPRYGDSKMSWLKQRVVGTFYTHHQKLVIVDSQGQGNNRKLAAFIGGLDLALGRYDTPEHPLFKTLPTIHRDDYNNPTFTGTIDHGGPREPWHDLHCKIEGPAVYDVLTNFSQRWKKSARWHEDALIEIERISWILSPASDPEEALMVTSLDDPETWDVQVFRSIDSGSVKGFPKEPAEAQRVNLVTLKNVVIDMSIHTAYVERIRSAQHFIYIENQYFLGSSYAWPDYKKGGATHMIPMELALKIASKIRSREKFAVYVIIPMWPEGVPDSASVQEILYFQSQTMKMMYKIIAQALDEVCSVNVPTDYLNFYCLGNRESRSEPGIMSPAEKSTQWYAQKYKRFMIYVHSKGMIVDDEYVIIGSANINQRSMDGSRDTEIAMGAYQPHHTWAKKGSHPFGQVYGFRASLWHEHLGYFDPEDFNDPSDLKCVHKVNDIAQSNWSKFISEESSDMKGHLMTYPMTVDRSGEIKPLPGNESFPDVAGHVLGQHSINLPDNLTG